MLRMCPDCDDGSMIMNGDKFCRKCGTKLVAVPTKKCRCGRARLLDDDSFCPACSRPRHEALRKKDTLRMLQKQMVDAYDQFRWSAHDRESELETTEWYEKEYKRLRARVLKAGGDPDAYIRKHGTKD